MIEWHELWKGKCGNTNFCLNIRGIRQFVPFVINVLDRQK